MDQHSRATCLKKGAIYTLRQDPVDPQLIFVGTEYGVFFTRDGGKKWIQIKGGLPTIAVRDMEIQERENDLVLGFLWSWFLHLGQLRPTPQPRRTLLERQRTSYPSRMH